MTLLSALSAAGLAVAVGTHVSTWGAYKDSPYEGYHPLRQLRTLLLAAVAAGVAAALGLVDPRALLPALGVVYTLERLATEWWKTIARRDDQSAYAIPMRLSVRGRPVDSGWRRGTVGVLVVAGLVATGCGVHLLQAAVPGLPGWLVVPLVGGLGGWLTAFGGAWKDAPVEGFSGRKFLRSPAVATAWAVPLAVLTTDWVILCLASGGLAVASIETYKTFLTRGRAPGKFDGKPTRRLPRGLRRTLGVGHAAGWVLFAAVAVGQAVLAPTTLALAVAAVVAALALGSAYVVLRCNATLTASPADRRRPAFAQRAGRWVRAVRAPAGLRPDVDPSQP